MVTNQRLLKIIKGLKGKQKASSLLGATGTGKTFTKWQILLKKLINLL